MLSFITSILKCYIIYSTTCLVDNAPGFNYTFMSISDSDDTLHFTDEIRVRNQIHCCAECLNENNRETHYHALFKPNENLCVCKQDFDWRQISSQLGVHEIKRIEVREGSCIYCHLPEEFFYFPSRYF